MSNLSNAHVVLSILEVKGHLGAPFGRGIESTRGLYGRGILVLLGRLVGSEWHRAFIWWPMVAWGNTGSKGFAGNILFCSRLKHINS